MFFRQSLALGSASCQEGGAFELVSVFGSILCLRLLDFGLVGGSLASNPKNLKAG